MTTDMKRRVFVKAGSLTLVSLGLDPIFLTRAAYAAGRSNPPKGPKTLICVFQRGAVDGLTMVVPHGEARYYASRPSLAIPRPGREGGVLDLDGHFGFHPEMRPLLPFFEDRSLAVVHAVGLPTATRSHFDAQDFMESGTPGIKTTPDGWLNRSLHRREHDDTPFRGVAMGATLPRTLRGTAPTLAIDNLATFGIGGRDPGADRVRAAFEDLYQGTATGIVAESSQETFEAIRMLRAANPGQFEPAHGAEYSNSEFGRSMRQLAQLIKAGVGLEIGFADLGGWDTHVNQGSSAGQLAQRLRDFSGNIAAFAIDLGPRMSDVTVLTMSEFGRTVRENGSRGTDHGRGTAMMVLGAGVNGGKVLGSWPTLETDQLEGGRDLRVTTDFRDLFSEIVVRHLGQSDLEQIFPGHDHNATRWVGAMKR